MREFITKNTEETTKSGEKILLEALRGAEKNKPLIFYLSGELGAGKTYFTKGIARAVGIGSITSPTFVLMKKFTLSSDRVTRRMTGQAPEKFCGKKYFFHIDCYRIYDAEDARQIGLDKLIATPRAIVAIEWAERISEIIPKPYWKVAFTYSGEKKRKIVIRQVTI